MSTCPPGSTENPAQTEGTAAQAWTHAYSVDGWSSKGPSHHGWTLITCGIGWDGSSNETEKNTLMR